MTTKWMIAACAMIMMSAAAMGQEQKTEGMSEDGMSYTYVKETTDLQPIYRSGNTYIMGNQTMNKYQYAAFLRNNSPAAFAKFNQGYNMASAGWGLLAGGLALTSGAVTMGFCHPVKDEVLPYHHAMDALFCVGNTLTTISIPLLIVGYCKQHNSANLYNASIGQPTAYWSINAGENGIGLALNF